METAAMSIDMNGLRHVKVAQMMRNGDNYIYSKVLNYYLTFKLLNCVGCESQLFCRDGFLNLFTVKLNEIPNSCKQSK